MPLPDDQIKEIITQRWDVSSENYDDHSGHGIKSAEEREAWKEIFTKALPAGASEILDVGCGTGELSILLAEMGYHVTGMDLSEKMLGRARSKAAAKNLDIRYERGDAENLPFDSNTFDVVFNRHVLWTLPNPQKALEGWKRVLKAGGRSMVIDGIWHDGSLDSRARRLINRICTMAVEGKDPWKDHYPEDLQSSLPNAGGTSLEKARGYMDIAGYKNVGSIDLAKIRDIQKKRMPFRNRICYNYTYYLLFGDN
jgi:ubiquinone/menaquinone biosynthesis C-methylase UbiE